MSWTEVLKDGATAFFVAVGVLGSLHFALGWPDEHDEIWAPAFAASIGTMVGQMWRSRKQPEND